MLQFHTLDVFTTSPYSGNPLAIVLGADDLSTTQMQRIAREFNLSETIFVQQPDDPSHTAKVRIFFPTAEIPFAGHPTIGCAILLAEQLNPRGDFSMQITLEEVAGLVPVSVKRIGQLITAEFTAPILPYDGGGTPPSAELAASGLGLSASDIGFGNHAPMHWQAGPDFMFVPVSSRGALAKAAPAAGWREMVNASGSEAYYVYCADGAGFAARMFAPDHGMPEDPATGSASAILAAQLLAAGAIDDGVQIVALRQGEDMGRPSEIFLTADVQAGKLVEIRIKGSAVHFNQGQIANLPL